MIANTKHPPRQSFCAVCVGEPLANEPLVLRPIDGRLYWCHRDCGVGIPVEEKQRTRPARKHRYAKLASGGMGYWARKLKKIESE